MQYETEFQFFQKMMLNMRIPFKIFQLPLNPSENLDLGLRKIINLNLDYQQLSAKFPRIFDHNKIYRITDEFMCRYLLFRIPETNIPTYAAVGPYTPGEVPSKKVLEIAGRYELPSQCLPIFDNYYRNLSLVADEGQILVPLFTLGEYLWGSLDNFLMQDVHNSLPIDLEPVAKRPVYKESEEAFLSMQLLEERYENENVLLKAVSLGLIHKAEMLMNNLTTHWMEERASSPIRNLKNYSIILNTLLKKAAEQGAVHPLHIDSLSSRFARKIELITNEKEGISLQHEMVHKYCLLVKNHSMKGYSLLIRKVLTRIDSDLTADLSLKKQAELLDVNPSYLSTLFKKETNCTLTEYVNRKRIEHAIFLLNSTSMQIQTVAQYSGIPDVNYFTKTFKKLVGKTPKEYRERLGR